MPFSLHTLWLWALWCGLVWLDKGRHLSTAVEVDYNTCFLHCCTAGVSKGRLGYNRAFSYMSNFKLASTHHLSALYVIHLKLAIFLRAPLNSGLQVVCSLGALAGEIHCTLPFDIRKNILPTLTLDLVWHFCCSQCTAGLDSDLGKEVGTRKEWVTDSRAG